MTMAIEEQPPTVKADHPIMIAGTDRKGRGRVWSFATPSPKIEVLLKKLNYEVTARHNGEDIGGVWKMNGHWVWAIEAWAIRKPEQYKRQRITSYPSGSETAVQNG